MLRLLMVAQESKTRAGLYASLTQNGLVCSVTSYYEAEETVVSQSLDLVLVEMDGQSPDSRTWELIHSVKQERHLPIMALVSEKVLDSLDGYPDLDDFLISPYDIRELILRVKQLLHRKGNADSNELIKCDGLVVDLTRCEVTVGGRVIELTFKEYELLKCLAGNNRGRVYTREALLNKIWGYDYYGGDRTVEVHIRRLRSKIEVSKHSFIETVRNIGYRFKKDM